MMRLCLCSLMQPTARNAYAIRIKNFGRNLAWGKAGAAFGFSVSQNTDMVGKLGNKPQEQLAENSVPKQAEPQQEAKREEKNDMASDDNEMSV